MLYGVRLSQKGYEKAVQFCSLRRTGKIAAIWTAWPGDGAKPKGKEQQGPGTMVAQMNKGNGECFTMRKSEEGHPKAEDITSLLPSGSALLVNLAWGVS